LWGALLSLKQVCLLPSQPQCLIRTFIGELAVQRGENGEAVDYQSYLGYIQHTGLDEVMASQWTRGGDRCDAVHTKHPVPGLTPAMEQFHCSLADIIGRLAEKSAR